MRISLRTRILMVFAGTTALLAAVVLICLADVTNTEINRVIHNDALATTRLFGQLMQERTATLTDECGLVAHLPVLVGAVQTQDPATVADEADDQIKQLHADFAFVTDYHGFLLGSTGRKPTTGKDERGDPGVRAALRNATWSAITLRNGHPVLEVTVPVCNGPTLVGTFCAFRDIDNQTAVDLHNDLSTGVIFVVNGNTNGASLPVPHKIHIPAGQPSIIELGDTRYLALYSPMPGSLPADHLGFITLRNYNQAVSPFLRLLRAFELVFAVALVASLLFGLLVARALLRPLDSVVHAAQTLQNGEWPERFDVRRKDEIGLLQSVFNDMTASIREAQDKLLGLIDSDPLTGLANHRSFHERLADEAQRCAASGERLTLLRVNVDHFRKYNEEWGHAAGDAALVEVAHVLRERHPGVAIMARFGGDEFAILMPQFTQAQAMVHAESVRSAIYARTVSGDIHLSASIGVAEFGTNTSKADGLLLAAELALSRAKSLGRNIVCGFDSVPGADETADPYQLYRFLKDESLATIQALAAAVDAKDHYTRGHSQSVAQYAADLGRHVGQSQADVDLLHTTGTLHDVGKIGVPDAILTKQGRLTPEERTIMETHPVLGELIVRKVPSLAATLAGIKHHHERWDGGGYPDRLTGDGIPKIARIMAIADCYDAMTSDRPYRKGLPVEVALAEIEKGAGTQFDPALAPQFVTMMRARHQVYRGPSASEINPNSAEAA